MNATKKKITIDDTLRGQSFIGKKDELENPRMCQYCINGTEDKEYIGSCSLKEAVALFNEPVLKSTLDKNEVGNYCPYFEFYS